MRDYHHNWLDEQGFPSNFRGGGYKSNWIISDIERCMSNGPDFYFFCTIYPASTWELPTNNSKFIAKQSKYVLIKSYVDVFVLYHWTFKYTVITTTTYFDLCIWAELNFLSEHDWYISLHCHHTSYQLNTSVSAFICTIYFHIVLAWCAANYNSAFLYYPRRQVITPCNDLSIEQLWLNK